MHVSSVDLSQPTPGELHQAKRQALPDELFGACPARWLHRFDLRNAAHLADTVWD
jgi:hypothetical protein